MVSTGSNNKSIELTKSRECFSDASGVYSVKLHFVK